MDSMRSSLTRNDKCFFALAFYRQTVEELFRAMFGGADSETCEALLRQATFWWETYQSRRKESYGQDFNLFRSPAYPLKITGRHKSRIEISSYSIKPLKKDAKK